SMRRRRRRWRIEKACDAKAPPLRLAAQATSPPARGRGKAGRAPDALPLPRRAGERWFAKRTGVGVDHCRGDDMLLIHCPYCGEERPELEFRNAGEAHVVRSSDMAAQSDEDF